METGNRKLEIGRRKPISVFVIASGLFRTNKKPPGWAVGHLRDRPYAGITRVRFQRSVREPPHPLSPASRAPVFLEGTVSPSTPPVKVLLSHRHMNPSHWAQPIQLPRVPRFLARRSRNETEPWLQEILNVEHRIMNLEQLPFREDLRSVVRHSILQVRYSTCRPEAPESWATPSMHESHPEETMSNPVGYGGVPVDNGQS